MKPGFTLTELAITLAIVVTLVPLLGALTRRVEEAMDVNAWEFAVADAIPDVAEAVRADARSGPPLTGEVGWAACGVRYVVREEVLVRTDSCTADRTIARSVESVAWAAGGIEVTFVRHLRPQLAVRRAVLVPVEGR